MAVHAQSNIQLNTIPAYTSLLGGHFVYRAHGTQGTPTSANVVESSENLSNPTQWGYNTHIGANGIKLRYNEIDLSSWTENGIEFYNPQSHETSANLSSTGLNITEGSINLGEEIQEYFISRDKYLNPSKTYYIYNGESYQAIPIERLFDTVIDTTDKNPKEEGWYKIVKNEKGEDIYVLTSDTSPVLNVQYYKLKDIVPRQASYYELRKTIPFQVTNDGYLNAQAGWIGGAESYVKLEKDAQTNGHYLDIRLSQLDMLLDRDLYGQENVVDVLDVVSQQSDFIRLWNGEEVWIYEENGQSYIVYQYIDNDTGNTNFYYNKNQYEEGTYVLSTDNIVDEDKEYYQKVDDEYVIIENPSGIPSSQNYYEYKPAEEDWQICPEEISKLDSISIAGLGQSLRFTDDSLGNQQTLIVSSANDTRQEKARVEIDPQYLKFLIESDNNLPLELSLNYDGEELDTNSLTIKSGEEKIFSIENEYDYALNTTTGFKAGPIGMFHYKNGLAIGLM